jgi:hypothetical protein
LIGYVQVRSEPNLRAVENAEGAYESL